jgi:protein-disulfide isomerase
MPIENRTRYAMPLVGLMVLLLVACPGERPREMDPDTDMPTTAAEWERVVQAAAQNPRLGHDRGDPDAPVYVMEFSDLGCPYCASFAFETFPALRDEYIATGRLRWKYIAVVMTGFPAVTEATMAVECAGAQEPAHFWSMRDRIYAGQDEWRGQTVPALIFRGYAAELGLDEAAFAICIQQGEQQNRLDASRTLAHRLGVRATPTFFIDGYPVEGALPLEQFRAVLEEMLAR